MTNEDLGNLKLCLVDMIARDPKAAIEIPGFRCSATELLGVVLDAAVYRNLLPQVMAACDKVLFTELVDPDFGFGELSPEALKRR